MVFETIYNAVFFHTGPILNLLYLKIHTNLWSIKKNLTGWGKYYCSQKVKFTTLEMMVRENLFLSLSISELVLEKGIFKSKMINNNFN